MKAEASPPKTLETLKQIPINKLPTEAKIVTAKALHELQFSTKKIADTLGLGERSIWRYVNEVDMPNMKEWRDYGEAVKKLFEAKENDVQSKVLVELEKQIEKAKFYDLVGLYKILGDAKRENNKLSGINVQQAVVFQVQKDSK